MLKQFLSVSLWRLLDPLLQWEASRIGHCNKDKNMYYWHNFQTSKNLNKSVEDSVAVIAADWAGGASANCTMGPVE